MITFGVILASGGFIVMAAFAAVVIGVRVTERQAGLRCPSGSRVDRFARRVLGVYADQPDRCESEIAERETVGR